MLTILSIIITLLTCSSLLLLPLTPETLQEGERGEERGREDVLVVIAADDFVDEV